MKTFLKLFFNFLAAFALCAVAGINPLLGAGAITSVTALTPHTPGAFLAGIYQEVWTGEQVKAFRSSVESIGWLNRITSYDQYVRPGIGIENDVIHLVAIGADPEVLINNTTYPLPKVVLPDGDIAISLDKYQTTATPITDDELHAITYDKMASVIERHRDAVNETKYAKAIHALAPQANTATTPVIPTTGAADGTRKRITIADIIALKKRFDDLKIPVPGRILVLCTDHVNDLLLADQKFKDQYYNYTTGKIANLYGFEIYEFQDNPYFTQAGTKPAWGGVPGATDSKASVAFFAPRMFKATGQTITYPTPAEATNQEHLYNLRHYFIALPKKQEAIGAIYNAAA